MEHGTQHTALSQEADNSRGPSSEGPAQSPESQKKEHFFVDIIRFALLAFVIVVPIRIFIAQPFIVQGASMLPTFETGQYLIVDQLTYRFELPERGEVIIFRHPNTPATFLIKRIVGLPGETIQFGERAVTVKNAEHPEGFVLDEPYINDQSRTYKPQTIVLGLGEYAVLGDNRDASSDSRVWGALDQGLVVGRAFLRLFPIQYADVFPGEYISQ